MNLVILFTRVKNSFVQYSILRQLHSLFQSLFSTDSDLVIPLSIYKILSFP